LRKVLFALKERQAGAVDILALWQKKFRKPLVFYAFRSPSFEQGEREDVDDFIVVEAAQDQLSGLKSGGCLR